MNLKNFFFTLLLSFSFLPPAFSFQILSSDQDFVYELYEPQDLIPTSLLEEARVMYFEAYQHPKLHSNIPLQSLHIDETRFNSYEEFIDCMFREDFASYNQLDTIQRYYFQSRLLSDGRVVGICVVYPEGEPGHYYLDHIGVHSDFRHRGIAQTLIAAVKNTLVNFKEIALDTRRFNTPAQALYEKTGFQIEPKNPRPHKQNTHFHYVLKE